MKEVLQLVIESLVDDKAAMTITETVGEKSINYEVRVKETDMGKVIGKQGKIAKSIRTVLKAIAAREKKRINIEFVG